MGKKGRRAQHEQVGRGCRAEWYSHYWSVEGASLAPPGPGTGCLHTFWLPVDTKAASLGAEGVNLGTGVCMGLQPAEAPQSPRGCSGQEREQRQGSVPGLEMESVHGSESAYLVLRLMIDATHTQGCLLARLCLAEHHRYHREPQKLAATRARHKETPGSRFLPARPQKRLF